MLLPIFMTALAIAGGPAPAADRSPSREAIQQAIERSLLFLEKGLGIGRTATIRWEPITAGRSWSKGHKLPAHPAIMCR